MAVRIIQGDCRAILDSLPAQSVHCCVTSPPYFGLRDYGVAGQIGLETSPAAFVATMVEIFRKVRRVLRDDGTLWLNLGDSYARSPQKGGSGFGGKEQAYLGDNYARARGAPLEPGAKPKDLLMIPARVAMALQAEGWYLRSDIIWHKPNPMPESVTDRPTSAHEHIFLLAKSEKYFYDADAIRESFQTDPKENYEERARITGRGDQGAAAARGNDRSKSGGFPPKRSEKQRGHGRRHDGFNDRWDQMSKDEQQSIGRNKRNVWTVATQPFSEAHFATFPPALIEPCILAGCPAGGTVLDPFGGAGTTGLVADRLGRNAILIELNPEYAAMAERRIHGDAPLFVDVSQEDAPC